MNYEKQHSLLHKSLIILAIIVAEVWTLFPIFWALITSFKTKGEIFTVTPTIFFTPTLRSYIELFTELSFGRWMLNSFIVSSLSAIIATFTGTMAGYAFTRFKFKGKTSLANFVLSLRILPPVASAVPIFILFNYLGLLDTYIALILAYIAFNLPLAIWMMMGFFSESLKQLEEAALVDGCNRFQVFIHIVSPLVKSGAIATFIICFMFAWNELLYAVFLAGSNTYTVTLALTRFVTIKRIDWAGLMAAGLTSVIPIYAVAFFVQRHLVRGLTFGAIKA
jgi:multiple sugar transport system permease protein